eukprot:CAMPEP_0170563874 /NCGR_PEP_ID=MMETSP0211-20121228/69462_1 /TAXON_ID=311385 /ORGANISM="Pseudokeronopsis sp., Strain OXSARD2" /LENGTH=40 /DNA_ID= /DNA_START= /DNA_END= /DNA_ORIENTATION=
MTKRTAEAITIEDLKTLVLDTKNEKINMHILKSLLNIEEE